MKQILLPFLMISYSGFVYGQLSGCYVSKRLKHDMFVTKIQLQENGTFQYEFVGDLVYNWGDGNYAIDTDQVVILNFGESDLDSKQEIIQSLSGGHEISGTMFYVLKRDQLYPLKENGRLDRKAYLIKLENENCKLRN